MSRQITIRGATEHNLKGADLSIPHDALVVVTGVSGSGKSSLVYDTIFREGQRRYLESLSAYARQLLGKMDRPAVEHISGLRAALAVDQRTIVRTPRSTVGTLSELYDHLRLLFARIGQCHCPSCGARLESTTPDALATRLSARYGTTPITILAPLVSGHRGAQRQVLLRAELAGVAEVRIDGRRLPLAPLPEVSADRVHDIEAVVADLDAPARRGDRVREAVRRALDLGQGALLVLPAHAGEASHAVKPAAPERLSIRRVCPACGRGFPEVGPRLFSFNSHYGACPTCKGLGEVDRIDPDLLIADPGRTLREGALVPTTPNGYIVYSQVTLDVLDQVCRAHGFSVDVPWRDLTDEQKSVILRGSDRIRVPFGKHPLESRMRWSGITARPREEGYYRGLLTIMEEILARERNANIMRFARSRPCPDCDGSRLRPEARSVTVAGRDIATLSALPLEELQEVLTREVIAASSSGLAGPAGLAGPTGPAGPAGPAGLAEVAQPILEAMTSRLELLAELGLGYLELRRAAASLSAGESQRIRLATQVGTALRGILYVLDEPSVGLHPRDTRRLLGTLARLRDNGNSVLVVEHDEETIRAADWLIDIGPGAGEGGGEILYNGPAPGFLNPEAGPAPAPHPRSRTYAYLEGGRRLALPETRRSGSGELVVEGARAHNLQNLTVSFKLGAFNVVTGVSGAGKSTLVDLVLGRALRRRLQRATAEPGAHDHLRGAEAINKAIEIDQHPIGRTPRSNPATYTKVFDPIRSLFAALPEARAGGWDKGAFSLNVKGGRCEACQGAGVQTIGMHFMGEVAVVCEACGGRRVHDRILTVTHQGRSIRDVLDLSVDEAAGVFADQPKIAGMLGALQAVGLGYIRLGQPATTFSGGEAQRIKLAAELGRPSTGRTLYILDEPTTGLHAADIEVLLDALTRLVERGNTIVAVEHDLEFVKMADWVVDLGPEGGARGGQLVAAGTPEVVAAEEGSHTGRALRTVLDRRPMERRPMERRPGTAGTAAAMGAGIPAQSTAPDSAPPPIVLRQVATHNLRDIDVEIPAERLTVVTGVSGSGKSSLAFDTLFAEGQRRFQESLAPHARRYLGRRTRAELGSATGLTPTIALGQAAGARNPRATVGTASEIYDYYRVLFSRVGEAHCPHCSVMLDSGRCPSCDFRGTYPLSATLFSFNRHLGACSRCRGLGTITVVDPDALITHPQRPITAGAMDGHKTGRFYGDPAGQHVAILTAVGRDHGIDLSRPWEALSPEAKRIVMHGTGKKRYRVIWAYKRGKREGTHTFESTWEGFAGYVNEEYERKHADHRGEAMRPLMRADPCPECNGTRLAPEVRSVRFAGTDIVWLTRLSVEASRAWWQKLENDPASMQVTSRQRVVIADLSREVQRRLAALDAAGLGYLTLDRATPTLSGGETQRLRLATHLGSELSGITYVLDEPTSGLHPRDTRRLLDVVRRLCDAGNTVVIVEHDAQVIRAADHVLDLGPGAGRNGGHLIFSGPPAALADAPQSRTGLHLRSGDRRRTGTHLRSGDRRPTGLYPRSGDQRPTGRALRLGLMIEGAHANNLRELDVAVPAGGLVVVSGVSGSGKSTLLFDVLAPSFTNGRPVGCRGFCGRERFAGLRTLDAAPLAGGGQSIVATLTGIFDTLRSLFAATPAARERGLGARRFSLAGKGGRCEQCQGQGRVRVSMDFLSDVWITCEACRGRRYDDETLACTYQGASIADVLAMSVSEAGAFLSADPEGRDLAPAFSLLERIGLGYLLLGQPARTLSGGERQRLKLVRDLLEAPSGSSSARESAPGSAGWLHLLDEPTKGLHFEDLDRLLALFDELIAAGDSVVAIEHHPDVIRAADWVIDLGPEGGDRGGTIVVQGTPEDLSRAAGSHTGAVLRGE